MNRNLTKKIMSVFFGMWVSFVVTQPLTAQWTVAVLSDTSATTFAQLANQTKQIALQTENLFDSKTMSFKTVAEYIKQAERWLQTVEHFTNSIIGDIKRFTSLKGILGTVEKQLGLSDDTLKALRDIGDIIRGAFTLKNNFISLIRTRLSMIESLEARARKGIFNPSQDLKDLEEYLRYSIGREAAVTLATRQKLAEIDPLIERLTYELQKIRAERAAKQKELDSINQQLGRESSLQAQSRTAGVDENGNSTTVFDESRQSLSPEAVQTLTLRAGQIESQIADLDKQEQKLLAEIQERYESLQKKFESAYLKGRYWNSVLQGWQDLEVVKKKEIEKMIDTYGTNQSTTPVSTP